MYSVVGSSCLVFVVIWRDYYGFRSQSGNPLCSNLEKGAARKHWDEYPMVVDEKDLPQIVILIG
jgi:hypothetical protein